MNKNNSIFVQKTNKNKKNDVISSSSDDNGKMQLSKKIILSSIPQAALTIENKELNDTHIEWRWRIYKIPIFESSREMIEISYKKPYLQRMFATKKGEWIPYEMPKEYETYIINQYYTYIEDK